MEKELNEEKVKRQDTQNESEGAEFLVLGNLLILGIPSYKAYKNMQGFDIVAFNPRDNISCRIQVKSRWSTTARGFLIKNHFDTDFIVIVKLNRGDKQGKAEVLDPEFFIYAKSELDNIPKSEKWGKINFKDMPDFENHKNRWDFIRNALGLD